MNIDRHNYEEWFLLYADDELSAAERREVEAFTERNPDLASELDILQQLKLDPSDDLHFSHKNSLYRSEEQTVSEEDSRLLSYLDGELHGREKEAVEYQLSSDPGVAKKLDQFRSAKLTAETLVYPHKAELYKHLGRQAPILSMRWVRVAVAAAVILSGGLLWFSQQSAVSSQQAGGSQQQATSNKQPATSNQQPATSNKQLASTIEHSAVTKVSLKRNNEGSRNDVAENNGNEHPTLDIPLPTPDHPQPTTDNRQLTTDNRQLTTPSNNLPTLTQDVAVTTVPAETAKEIVDQPSTGSVASSDYATQALLHPDEQANPTVADEGGRSRKSPFRGLVRKANRFFNKATNPDPDKATVRVASFEIALGR